MTPSLYLCEKCLSEQRITFNELVLLTSDRKPLRCTDPTCPGYAYLASTPSNEKYMRQRDRSRPLVRMGYGKR